jgi:hypothetical protein
MKRFYPCLIGLVLAISLSILPALAQDLPALPDDETEAVTTDQVVPGTPEAPAEEFAPDELTPDDATPMDEFDAPEEAAPQEVIIPQLELKGVDVTQAVMFLFKASGVSNYLIDPAVKGSVTVSLRDVPFTQALRSILDMVGATFQKEDGIYRIVPASEVPEGGTEGNYTDITAPKRLRVFQPRFLDAAEIAILFGGTTSRWSSFGSGGYGNNQGGGARNTGRNTGRNTNTNRNTGTGGVGGRGGGGGGGGRDGGGVGGRGGGGGGGGGGRGGG